MQKAALLLIPLAVAILGVQFKDAIGPYWLGVNSDPSYVYLVNSLYILDHIVPQFHQHPGTSLQILGALIIKICNWNVTTEQLIRNVFYDPEYYLNTLHYVLFGLFLSTLVWVGWYGTKKTGSVLFGILVQLPPFLYFALREYGGGRGCFIPVPVNINPESLIMTAVNLYNLVLLRFVFHDRGQSRSTAFLWGMTGGLGLATKFTFLPLLVLPMLVLPGVRSRLIFCVSTIAGFLMWTVPIWPRFKFMIAEFSKFITHKAAYGGGEAGFDAGRYLYGLKTLATNHTVFLIFAVLCFGAGIFLWFKDREQRKISAIVAALAFIILLYFGILAKQAVPHYITPALGIFGILAGFLLLAVRKRYALFDRVFVALAMGVIVFTCLSSFRCVGYLAKKNHGILEFSKKVYTDYADCTICGYYRSSSVPFALHFGDSISGYLAYGGVLRDLYPKDYFLNFWLRHFFDGTKRVFFEDLKMMNDCILIYGSNYSHDFQDGSFLTVEKIASSDFESVYRVKNSTAREALQHLLMAQVYAARHDYRSALLHALRSKSLGQYDMDPYIESLKVKLTEQLKTP